MRAISLALLAVVFNSAAASARDVTVASWNLGWHMDRGLAAEWIEKCNGMFAPDASGTWRPTTGTTGKPGWEVDFYGKVEWDWAKYPVCNVYQTANRKVGPVTLPAYEKRLTQAEQFLREKLKEDIIAFQEVTGEEAVRQVLPSGGADYGICSFTGYKAQRLAIAWRKTLGEQVECAPEDALSLPGNQEEDRPRPGLSLALRVDGELVRILAVHMKSSCVTPLARGGRDNLAGDDDDCQILQQQVVPFETWIEEKSADTDRIILLGDFNRNFWHEVHDQGPVRTDGSAPDTPLPAGVKVADFHAEVFDDAPAHSTFTLLEETCPVNQVASSLCTEGKTRVLDSTEVDLLGSSRYLGCRNPLGLDHILIGTGVTPTGGAEHVAIGPFGGTKPASGAFPDPLLAVSDHCPMMARLSL